MQFLSSPCKDVLESIFALLDNVKDCLNFLLVTKEWNKIVKSQDLKWKELCQEFWKRHFSIPLPFDLEFIQKESNRSWLW
jgi:hypothetical protein